MPLIHYLRCHMCELYRTESIALRGRTPVWFSSRTKPSTVEGCFSSHCLGMTEHKEVLPTWVVISLVKLNSIPTKYCVDPSEQLASLETKSLRLSIY